MITASVVATEVPIMSGKFRGDPLKNRENADIVESFAVGGKRFQTLRLVETLRLG